MRWLDTIVQFLQTFGVVLGILLACSAIAVGIVYAWRVVAIIIATKRAEHEVARELRRLKDAEEWEHA